jgi:hypothetical protein
MTRIFAMSLLLIVSAVMVLGCESGTEKKATTPPTNTTEKTTDEKPK